MENQEPGDSMDSVDVPSTNDKIGLESDPSDLAHRGIEFLIIQKSLCLL